MLIYIGTMYFVLLLGVVFKPNQTERKKIIFSFFITIVFVLLAAFRSSSVGTDTFQYYEAYKSIASMNFFESFQYLRYEPLFTLLCFLLNNITNSGQMIIIASSVIIFSFVGYFIHKNSQDIALSWFLFLAFNFYAVYLNLMRQAIAISILMFCLDGLIRSKKYINFIIGVIVASFFHSSALIAFVYLAFYKKRYTWKIWCLIILLAIGMGCLTRYMVGITVAIFPYYQAYIGSQYDIENYFGMIVYFLIAFLILTYVSVYLFKNHDDGLGEGINVLLGLVAIEVVIDAMGTQFVLLERLRYYFDFSYIIIIPWTILQEKNCVVRFALRILIITLVTFYFIALNLYRPEWNNVVPYEMFF